MVRNFKSEDEGKSVMTADGDIVGRVEKVSGSTAHVKAEGGLSQSIRRRLGWTEEEEDTYELRKSNVDEITDDGIRLKKNL
jgi:hypothetical protein